MICVYADEDMPAACQKLREAKYLYAVYNQYVPKETKQILNGEWLEKVITCQPLFAFLLADSSCNEQTQKEIYLREQLHVINDFSLFCKNCFYIFQE